MGARKNSFRKVSRIGFVRRRDRARGLIEAIESQRKGQEGAFTDIPIYYLIGTRELLIRLTVGMIVAAAYVLFLYGIGALNAPYTGWKFNLFATIVMALVLAAWVCGWNFFKYSYPKGAKCHFFFSKKQISKLRVNLTRMQNWSTEMQIIREEQAEVQQAYEDLRNEIETSLRGELKLCENYKTGDLRKVFYYRLSLPNPSSDSSDDYMRFSRFYLTEEGWGLMCRILADWKVAMGYGR